MPQNDFRFLGNLILICNGKLSLLLRDNLKLAVKVLRSSPKVSDLIKNGFSWLNLDRRVEKVGQKYFPEDFLSFWAEVPHSLPKSFQKQALLCI